jgi:mannose-6-phosphate isomerase-like protein (cupin superfamily)
MEGFHGDLKELAKDNEFYRKVIHTGAHAQLVLMSLAPGEEIGNEVHEVDQFFYAVDGKGQIDIGGQPVEFEKGDAVFVPAHSRHNVINTDDESLKLFTIYSPPQHAPGTLQEKKPAVATVSV